MSKLVAAALSILLIAMILSSGCGAKPGGTNASTGKKNTTPTVSPTPAFGNLMLSTNPVGASVFLNGTYKGVTPLNLTNLTVGKHNISLQMETFSNNNFTAEVKGGRTVTISKSMSEAKPKIEINLVNASVREIPPCIWTFVGNLANTGDEKIFDVVFTIEMKPKNSEFKTETKIMDIGDISPGMSKPFGMDITVLCEGNYQATLKWEGEELNVLRINSDDKILSGSKKV